MPSSKWKNHFIQSSIFKRHRQQYWGLTSVNQFSLYSVEDILWYHQLPVLSLICCTICNYNTVDVLNKPYSGSNRGGCNFPVICMLCWCTGYEGPYRDSFSLHVMHSLFKRKQLQAGFPWSKSSTRAEPSLNFHGAAENKCMFTVMVNLQTSEGIWLFRPGKSLWNEALN